MLPVGTLLQNGKYRVDRYLASGGFGNTYVATNLFFNEQVAIKEFFMRGVSERDNDSLSVSVSNGINVNQFVNQKEKFHKEARRLRKLRNDHIVAVHDLFEENGTAYYEMDYIDGESLGKRLNRTGQPFAETEVLNILNQVLDALELVHAQGIYHLDLKPANIMIEDTGRVLLIDFGASKQMRNSDGLSVSTSSALAFTPGYAPLEQTEQSTKSFGPWTDLYALGATLYKLLTNLTPPSASELLVSRTPLLFPVPVSPNMQQLIAWMMKPRYDERPQSVADVKNYLLKEKGLKTDVNIQKESENTVVVEQPQANHPPKYENKNTSSEVLQTRNKKGTSLKWAVLPAILLVVFVGIVGLFVIFYNHNEVPDPIIIEQPVTQPIRNNNTSIDDEPLATQPTAAPQRTNSTQSTQQVRRTNNSTKRNPSSSPHDGKVNSGSERDPVSKVNGRTSTPSSTTTSTTPTKPSTPSGGNSDEFKPNIGDW